MSRVGIAMSGGVDSSVTASLLKQQGHDVCGFFMKLPLPGVEEHLARVRAVAGKLDIPLSAVDMQPLFTKRVLNVFVETYRKGSTPNPCIICNHQIKFGALRNYMHEQGMESIATGHYARTANTGNGQVAIRRGVDTTKDQSYFLCRLTHEQLAHIILPLGEMKKTDVYTLAAEMGLENIHGPESQDVCFLAGQSIASFFGKQGIPDKPGDIVTADGKILGTHRGLWHYTIGQRRGLGLPDASPWYVRALDESRNRVIVCKHDDLITSQAWVSDVQWAKTPPTRWNGLVQVRGRHKPSPAVIEAVSGSEWHIRFAEPQRAITPGQFAAFYEDDVICGSGIITRHTGSEEI